MCPKFFKIVVLSSNRVVRGDTMNIWESISNQTDVALSLAKHVITTAAKNTNLVFSPLSMQVVLGMVAAGSGGPTRDQLLGYLKSNSVDESSYLASLLATQLFVDGGPLGGPRLSFANRVWVEQSSTLKPVFREIVDKMYHSVSYNVDFQNKAEEVRQAVNAWAEKETNGLIKDLLPQGTVDSSSRVVLANALYFKGTWENKFDASWTKLDNFFLLNGSSVQVPFMTSLEKQYIRRFDGFKVLCLPYEQGQEERRFSMYIFLPDARDGLPSLVDSFGSTPGFIQHHLPCERVSVRYFRIPKFKMTSHFEASGVLRGQGLVLPFSGGGLTEMVERDGVDISVFVHKAFIEVDEQGTEAAAASAAVAMFGCSLGYQPEPLDFVADHAFLFVIREDKSGLVLFVGQVLDPLAG